MFYWAKMFCEKFLSVNKNAVITQITRSFGKHNKKDIYKDGERFESVTYYPRTPNHQDPPVEPSKLFRVERVKPIKGVPYWEKRILKDLGIDEKLHSFNVIKNIPENNARLWKVKHLIKISPVTFPNGEPTANDVNYTVIKENGDCIVSKKIDVIETRLKATDEFENGPARLDGEILKKDSRLKWLNNW